MTEYFCLSNSTARIRSRLKTAPLTSTRTTTCGSASPSRRMTMKIRCVDGYFMFREQRVGEISDFISLFKLDLVSKEDYFTFAVLADAPNYALAGAPYLNATAIKTFAGRPWEVMRENDLVYNFETGKLVPLLSVT